MKKQFAAIFAATAVLGVTTAFAANPFSDVTPDSWAYQSVSQLARTGIINGYPDGTFKGQNNITRYEMAQMVAKAMANQDRANAEQQAMINRLADEFASELNNLGVRVAALENKVGNVKVTGDMRLRYKGNEDKGWMSTTNYDKKSKFDMRGRVQFNATVNEDTEAVVRITSDDMEFGDSATNDIEVDRAYVTHRFGDSVAVTAGRYGQVIGGGLMYDDTFDGANVVIGNEKVQFEAAHGYMLNGTQDNKSEDDNISMTYLGLKGKVADNTTLGGFWLNGNKKFDDEVYGFNVDANFGKVWVGGEWLDMNDTDDASAWVAGIGYGAYNVSKAGTWDVKAQYFDQDKKAPIVSSTWNQAYDATNTWDKGYKGWMATVDYALQNNVGLSAYYGFSSEDQKGNDLGDFYRAEVNYKF